MTYGSAGRLGGVQFYSAPHLKCSSGQPALRAFSKQQKGNSDVWMTHPINLPPQPNYPQGMGRLTAKCHRETHWRGSEGTTDAHNWVDESLGPSVPLLTCEVHGQQHLPPTCLGRLFWGLQAMLAKCLELWKILEFRWMECQVTVDTLNPRSFPTSTEALCHLLMQMSLHFDQINN